MRPISLEVKLVADKLVEMLSAGDVDRETAITSILFVTCFASADAAGRLTFLNSLVLELANRTTIAALTPELLRTHAAVQMALNAVRGAVPEVVAAIEKARDR